MKPRRLFGKLPRPIELPSGDKGHVEGHAEGKSLTDLVEGESTRVQKELKTDIYGFGNKVYRANPRLREQLEPRRNEEVFPNPEINFQVKDPRAGSGSRLWPAQPVSTPSDRRTSRAKAPYSGARVRTLPDLVLNTKVRRPDPGVA